jgi:hypothetical protein
MNYKKNFLYLVLALLLPLGSNAQFGRDMGSFGRMGSGGSMSDRNGYSSLLYFLTYKKKKENGENVDYYYRGQQGLTFGLVNATYKIDYTYASGTDANGNTNYFTGNLERNIKGKAYGISGEHYFPLGKSSEESLIALTIGVDAIYMKLDFEEIRLNGGQRYTPEHVIIQGNVPIGLAYKSGSDAVLRRNIKSGFSLGAGALLNGNINLQVDRPSFNLRPYCMAEMAFYTGFCWKIRGTAHLGKSILSRGAENVGLSGSEQETTATIQTKTNFLLSLIFMDFSYDWDDE